MICYYYQIPSQIGSSHRFMIVGFYLHDTQHDGPIDQRTHVVWAHSQKLCMFVIYVLFILSLDVIQKNLVRTLADPWPKQKIRFY